MFCTYGNYEIEGACYASLEYLLYGLPVISTQSVGGRDVYHDDNNSIICVPDINSVNNAIQLCLCKIKNGEYDPISVRNNAIEKILFYREIFYNVIKKIFEENNINDDIPKLRKVTLHYNNLS